MRRRDPLTQDMFGALTTSAGCMSVPAPAKPLHAAYDFRPMVSGLVSAALDAALEDARLDRRQVAAEMTRLKGEEVSKYMLDAYSSTARSEYNIPFYLVPALESACRTHLLSAWLADVRGGRLLIGKEALHAELGRLERMRDDAAKDIREIKRRLGDNS